MLKKLLFFILLLVVSYQANVLQGETRHYFKDWLVNCLNDSENICRAVTHIRNKVLFPYGDGTIFQFIVQQRLNSKNIKTEIIFYHVLENAYPDNRAVFSIDNNQSFEFELLETDSLNERRLSQTDTKLILNLLKASRWLTIKYISQAAEPIEIKLSLRGITAAINFSEAHLNKQK